MFGRLKNSWNKHLRRSPLFYLRIFLLEISAIAAILLAALWVRSFFIKDDLRGPTSVDTGLAIQSNHGRLVAYTLTFAPETAAPGHEFRWEHHTYKEEREPFPGPAWKLTHDAVKFPILAPAVLFGSFALVAFRWPSGFSRRFIVSGLTLIVLLFGIVAVWG